MDVYENLCATIDARVEDLLSQMTLEEKTCQTATLYGYNACSRTRLQPPTGKTKSGKTASPTSTSTSTAGGGREKHLRHRHRKARLGDERGAALLCRANTARHSGGFHERRFAWRSRPLPLVFRPSWAWAIPGIGNWCAKSDASRRVKRARLVTPISMRQPSTSRAISVGDEWKTRTGKIRFSRRVSASRW